jgi:hypothetical protein
MEAAAWTKDCGKKGKTPCMVSEAKFEGKQGGLCATGQIFDLIDGGSCWTCPSGYGRTIFPVNGDSACEKVASTDFRRANENNKGTGFFGTDCPGGQFWDIVDGKCHSCDAGYAMQVFEHVHSGNKCARTIPGNFARATKIGPPCGAGKLWDPRNGGECWSCPDGFVRTIAPVDSGYACEFKFIGGFTGLLGCDQGLSSIRNVCVETNVCGKEGQRPCEVSERLPSCDAGLREDFKTNVCVKLRAGEMPFTGGLSSLAGFWGATLQGRCKQLLGSIDIPGSTNTAVAARCSKDAAVGFACAFIRDLAAGYTDLANTALESAPTVGTLAEQMNAAANKPPCSDFREKFSKATLHGKGTGVIKTDCAAGQFWDPDGNCYSCPTEYTRTLYPVTHERACTDRVAGNLQQFGCGAIEGIKAKFGGPSNCEVEMLENGSIFDKPIDVKNADQVVCMATGELGYNIVKAGFEAGKAAATGDISGIIATISKIKGTGTHAFDLQRLLACRRNAK